MSQNTINSSSENSYRHIKKLLLLSVAMVWTMTTWFSMTAVLPELTELWSLTSTQGSLVTIMVQAGFVVGSLLSAFLNLPDRLDLSRMFFGAALVAGFATIATALFSSSYASALIFRFLTGVALAGVYGPGLKLMATWFKVRRGMALGFVVGALTLGSASPHLFRGFSVGSWEIVLMVSGLASILAGLLVVFTVNNGPYPLPKAPFDPAAIPRALRHTPVRLANYGYFGHMWELYAMWAWFGLFLLNSLQTSGVENPSSLASFLTFIVIAAGFFGAWFGGMIADKFGRERLTLWSLATSGSIALLIGFFYGKSIWIIVILGIIWGISIIADSAQFSALITEHADQRFVGSVLTFQLAVGFAITMIVILLVPVLEAIVGWQYAFLLLVPGPVLGFLAMLRLHKVTSKV
ncbi:MFS transporter [Evansella cellulosilytica]|uniref:Major facilitator superfamily MFS_1 n=1 Tax=Evansella cellulosilytica (strain ATCC 21833 / DSM 2522 / FERM P-1141 / JCM 9156 / N-4) TaxID=649639 RepID=E6TYB3_EVAC2|nr:MFS transporter [Evansella cellulosilytica]ADU28851.1 major facilitator superfamily MFS_1 [Evansella cellulosilytica DSM 2522]